jgi:YgiT-type zinc finger domain-containing protein
MPMNDPGRPDKFVAKLTDVEGRPCIVCPEGQLEVSTFTKTMERGETTLVVKKVPALVCDTCGDAGYTEAIGQRLAEMLEAADEAGIETAVRTFEQKTAA